MALADFPRHPLTFGPSPVHPLDRLSGSPRRRPDLGPSARTSTPALAFGGNKTRKLEYIVPDVLALRQPTRSSRSAGCRATTPGRWRRWRRTSA